MNKRGVELPVNTIVIVLISLLVLVLVVIFIQIALGKTIFPELLEKLKSAFGLLNQSKQALPSP